MAKNIDKFDWNICGHKNIVHFLQSAIVSQKIAHGYLFVGPAHVGKYTVAKEFIASILCQSEIGPIPCGECLHCQQLENSIHPDVYLVEKMTDEKTGKSKKNIVIDQIRDLKNRLQQATLLNDHKVAVIPEAQSINTNAANALLKVLEEPTPKTVIILIAENIDSLPQTILSRCQILKFLPIASNEIEKYLTYHESDIDKAKTARLSFGRPGLAISLSSNEEQQKKYSQNINYFFKILGSGLSQRFNIVADIIDWSKDEVNNIKELNGLFDDWQIILRDLSLFKNNNEPLVANIDYLEIIKKQSDSFSFSKIISVLNNINQAKKYFKYNVNSKLILENLIINL